MGTGDARGAISCGETMRFGTPIDQNEGSTCLLNAADDQRYACISWSAHVEEAVLMCMQNAGERAHLETLTTSARRWAASWRIPEQVPAHHPSLYL
jgi:hypothetical protein